MNELGIIWFENEIPAKERKVEDRVFVIIFSILTSAAILISYFNFNKGALVAGVTIVAACVGVFVTAGRYLQVRRRDRHIFPLKIGLSNAGLDLEYADGRKNKIDWDRIKGTRIFIEPTKYFASISPPRCELIGDLKDKKMLLVDIRGKAAYAVHDYFQQFDRKQ
jgi:hypothetical protein